MIDLFFFFGPKGFLLDVFREFFAENADMFADASATPSDEQNLEYYELFQKYLRLYEHTLSKYIESLKCTPEEFYYELAAVRDDPTITDKKLIHFVNYLVACTDYPSFYKVMYRAAKKNRASEFKSEGKEDSSPSKRDAKGEGKDYK